MHLIELTAYLILNTDTGLTLHYDPGMGAILPRVEVHGLVVGQSRVFSAPAHDPAAIWAAIRARATPLPALADRDRLADGLLRDLLAAILPGGQSAIAELGLVESVRRATEIIEEGREHRVGPVS